MLLGFVGFSVGHLLLPFGENPCIANIKLVNFSRTDQWLNRGTVLGKLDTVEVMRKQLDEADRLNEPTVGLLSIADPTTPFADVINKQLPSADHRAVLHLQNRFSDCFASSNSDLGRSNIVQHRIDTMNSTPIHQPPYKSAWKQREVIESQVQDMIRDQVIEPSSGPWASPVVLVKKKDGSWRFCVDYRKLNAVTTRDVYPLPRIEDALSRLKGTRYFSIMDMQAGYWQDLDLEIVHRSGHLHLDADALSRNPVAPPEDTPEIPLLSLQTVDKESIKAEQEMSGWWRPIILGLREKDPTNLTRKLIRHYEIREGLLYHRVIKNGRAYYRLCLIPSLVEPVLLACNDDIAKQKKTCRKSEWDVTSDFYPATIPKSRDRTDRPLSLSRLKNKYVIIAIDYLTKWVIAQPVRSAKTKDVVDFFVRHVVLQHGAPSILISDRVTAAYHPQCNGLVERFNHTFAEMLSMYVSSCHDDWDEFIDFVVFAYNTSHQESTSVSLLYGREAVLPIDVVLGNNSNPIASGDDPSERIRNLAGHLETIRRIVRKRLDAVQNRQKERYDDHRKNVSFAVGSLVWIYRPYRKKGRSEKLLHRYHGPFKIVRKVSDLHYIVAPISGRRKLQERVHVANLKPCLQRRLTPLSKPAVTASNTINEKHQCFEKSQRWWPASTPNRM
ncbi:Uncharacterized protein APZ42_028454 [Daphnia magna]|uniref:Integrase catalytic domain-containing protein n=1 Tax=Daphnia magna TaxID=35525 RepID=A0A164QHD3_9CRUS|nr:Uncharacterized protein APZ42_028454 [Daphnia magna]